MSRGRAARAAVLLSVLLAACDGGPTESPFAYFADRDQDGLADTVEAALLAQYRPFWVFDGAEAISPISVTEWGELGGSLAAGPDTVLYSDLATLLAAVLLHPVGTLQLPPGPLAGRFDAPVYAEAVRMPAGFAIGGRTDLVWLHYFLLFADDVKEYFPAASHRGDWEHVCVMVERAAAGDPARPPIMIHWHHHGNADIAAEAEAWHADAAGSFHPRAYVERGSHGMYRVRPPAPPPDPGPSPLADPLSPPLIFLREHAAQSGDAALEARIVGEYFGRWGQTPPTVVLGGTVASPQGPLVFNGVCDHDYSVYPSDDQFALEGCQGP